MKENTAERASVWNDAARGGLVLGLVSIVYMVCTNLMEKIQASGVGAALLNVSEILLWVFKLYLCIRLMKFFMQRFAAGNENATNKDTFCLGTATALLSALIYSGFTLAWLLFFHPDMATETMEAAVQMYENVFTQDQLDTIREMAPRIPTISFFVNLIWCWLFGTVLAAIFSRSIPSRNPFEETDNQ